MNPRVWVNGESRPVEAATVAALLVELGYPLDRAGLAVAQNDEVVPRGAWGETRLAPGDRIEIVGAVQGGSR